MISKEEYVLRYIRNYLEWKAKENERVEPLRLISLIEQIEFDYGMDSEYRPEVLSLEKFRNSNHNSEW